MAMGVSGARNNTQACPPAGQSGKEQTDVPPLDSQLATLLQHIEAEMRRIGLWQDQSPAPEALQIDAAFAHSRLAFSQWLQFVLLPRVRLILQEHGPFPERSQVGTIAIREWDTFPAADRLIGLLCELDQHVNRRWQSPSAGTED